MARLQLLQKLRESGFDVDVAVSGQLALDRMRSAVPDAIFMDLLLPDIKGVDVIKAVRQDKNFRDRPIYVCTSAALIDTWTRRATKAGATKVFNRAATPVDVIVAEVTADLGGNASPASKGTPPVSSSASNQKSPSRAADTPKSPPAIQREAERTKREAAKPEPASRPAPLLQRVFNSFKFSKDPVPAPAVPPPTRAPVPAAGPAPIPNLSCPEDQAPAASPSFPAEPYQLNSAPSVTFAETLIPSLSDQAAVVSFDETGTIVSANKACATMFGWEDTSLVGEGLAALLRPGTDQDVRRFIHERLHGGSTEGGQSLNVVARRRDGVEFPATVTTLIWSSETKVIRKSDSSFSCLTAIFRAQTPVQAAPSVPPVAFRKGAGASPVATSLAPTAGVPEAPAISQQAYDEVQRQFSAISTEAEALRESLARRERETGDVTNRLTSYEEEIKRTQAALEAERAERKKTEERSQELAAKVAELEQRSVQQNQDPKNQESDPGANRLSQELSEARAALATVDEAFNQNVAHCGKLEAERLEMRREIEALNARLASLHEQAAEPARRTEELEERLQGVLENLDRMRSDPEARSEVERNLESELGAAKAAAQHAESCLREEVDRSQSFERRLDVLCSNLRQEQTERSKRFEEECSRHREEREALNRQLSAEQTKADEAKRHAEELEGNLAGNQADLERVRSELEHRIDEHRRSEAEWRQKLEEADAQARKLAEALHLAEQRAKALQQELNALQQDRTELDERFGAEQQAAAEIKFRVNDLEERLRQNAAELEQVKSDRANAATQQASEMAMANLYHMRDLLGSKLEIERRVAAESDKRSQVVEEQLRKNSAELDRVKEELNKQSDEQVVLERKLEQQLSEARIAAGQADATLNAKQEECGRLQSDLTELQQAGDDLKNRLNMVQQAADRAKQTSAEFEQQLQERTGELERVKAEQLRQAEEQKKIELELQAQVLAAKSATERAVAACDEEAQRNRAFEERLRLLGDSLKQEQLERTRRMQGELDALRQTCGKLTENHAAEQEAAMAARKQCEALEKQLHARGAELAGFSQEQSRLSQELGQVKSALQAARAALEQSDGKVKGKTDECGRLHAELEQTRADLNGKLAAEQQAVAAARQQSVQLEQQLRAKSDEAKQLVATQAKRGQEQTHLEKELQAAKAALQRAEVSSREKAAESGRLQAELQKMRADLSEKLAAENRANVAARQQNEQLQQRFNKSSEEVERLKANQEKQNQEKARLQSELEAAKTLVAKTEPALNEKTKQAGQLAQEMTNLRNELEESKTQFAAQQQTLTKLKRQGKDIEKLKKTHEGEITKLNATVEEHMKARKQVELELQKKIAAANDAAARLRSDLETGAAERTQLQKELAARLSELEALKTELTAARQEAAEARQRHESVEARLGQAADELKRAQEARPAERDEFENQRLTEATATLNAELCRLREGHGSVEAQLLESQRQIQEGVTRLARATADFEKERGERRRAEHRVDSLTEQLQELHGQIKAHLDSGLANQSRMTNLEQHLRQNEDQLARVNDDLQKERTDRQLVEQQLRAADALSSQLRNCLTSFDLAKEGFKRAQVQLEARLQASQAALNESESKLKQEIAERLRRDEAMAEAQRNVQDQSQTIGTELAKLTAELEEERAERKRMEGGFAQSRYASLESARAGLAMVTRLRSQIREPVDGLMQLTRRLLEAELEDEPKKIVESLLENALLVQTTLQEAATLNACSGQDQRPEDGNGSRSVDPTVKKSRGKLQA